MKFKELINRTESDLKQELQKFIHEAEELRVKIRMGEVKNYKAFGKVRKDIARIKTLLTQKSDSSDVVK